uniref:SFRICE_034972 n=1 Tax=Spodoptera frugiperda TaxID=7108 RepID=A0A2H1WDE6_SPOFR
MKNEKSNDGVSCSFFSIRSNILERAPSFTDRQTDGQFMRLPEAQFTIFPIPDCSTTLTFLTLKGNALVTPLVFRVSMDSGDCLPLGDPSACLPAYTIKQMAWSIEILPVN